MSLKILLLTFNDIYKSYNYFTLFKYKFINKKMSLKILLLTFNDIYKSYNYFTLFKYFTSSSVRFLYSPTSRPLMFILPIWILLRPSTTFINPIIILHFLNILLHPLLDFYTLQLQGLLCLFFPSEFF